VNTTSRSRDSPGAIVKLDGWPAARAKLPVIWTADTTRFSEPVLNTRSLLRSWITLFGGWYVTPVSLLNCGDGGCTWMRLKTSRSLNGAPLRFW
jgi:hypothetical protein